VRAPIDQAAVANVLAPFGESRTLPREAYQSAELFAWEQEHIFNRHWVCLGRSENLLAPGQVRALAMGEEEVLLARDAEGTLRAFANVCRHRGHPLVPVGEAIDVRLIRCPYHSWSYRLDGSLRAAPVLTQNPDFDMSEWPLHAVRVEEWRGWAFLNLTEEAPTVAETMGNLDEVLAPYEPGRLQTVARHSYEIAANWKLVVENYHECYHCTSIHPELCQVTPVDSGEDIQPTGLWCGGTMVLKDHAVTMSLTGESQGANFRGLRAGQEREVLYLGVFPNLLISPHPDYVMTHRLVPLSPDRTFIECDWLFAPESLALDGFDPSYAVDFWDITNREDWTACESVMRGVNNRGYRPGPLSGWEGTVYQFLGIMAHAYLGDGLVVPTVPQRELRA
jgi:Rieske 2Fe-2S family protein